MRRTKNQPAPRKRRGVAAVEFALVAPLFVLLVLGIVEFGRMYMVQQVLTNAAREGTRRGVIESVTKTEVESLVFDYLASNSVTGAAVTISPNDLASVGLGDSVTVTVTVPFESVSWAPSWFLAGKNLEGQAIMRAERLQ